MSLNFYIFHLFVFFTLRMWIISSDLSSTSPILSLVALNLLNSPLNSFWKRFIYWLLFRLCRVFAATLRFLRLWWAGLSHRGAGLRLWRPLLLQSTGPRRVGVPSCHLRAPERRPNCSTTRGVFQGQGLNECPGAARPSLNHCTNREATALLTSMTKLFISTNVWVVF